MNAYQVKLKFCTGGEAYGIYGGKSEGDALRNAIRSLSCDHEIPEGEIITKIYSIRIW